MCLYRPASRCGGGQDGAPPIDGLSRRADRLGVLIFTEGAAKGRKFKITEKVTTIGRMPDNPLTLWDDRISRKHAQIELRGDDLWIVDLESTKMTWY